MHCATRTLITLSTGFLLLVLQMQACPESFEPVVYWSLPLFHTFFHPLLSGPIPLACFCSVLLNAGLASVVVFWFLPRPATTRIDPKSKG